MKLRNVLLAIVCGIVAGEFIADILNDLLGTAKPLEKPRKPTSIETAFIKQYEADWIAELA